MENEKLIEENEQVPEAPQPEKKQTNPAVNYWLAFFFGAIISAVVIVSILPSLANQVTSFIKVVGWGTIILAFIFLFVTIFKEGIFKFFLGFSQTDLKEIQTSGESLFDNYQNKDWEGAKEDLKVVGKKGLAWYSWKNYRLWVVQLFQVLFLGFVGLFGSMLLYNQNELLKKQNEKIDAQNLKIDSQIQLEESSRRGNLIVMMSNIMDKVDEELTNDWNGDSIQNLSPQLIGRIAALSYAFRPYRFWQDSMLIEKPYSPERGQLLLALVNSNLDSLTYDYIYQQVTFEQAYLEKAILIGKNLSGVNLSKASLKEANLSVANLKRTSFMDADLSKAKLFGATFENSGLSRANLTAADLSHAQINETALNNAILEGANLIYSTLRRTDLSETRLDNVMVSSKDWLQNLEKLEITGMEEISRKYEVNGTLQKGALVNFYLIKPKS